MDGPIGDTFLSKFPNIFSEVPAKERERRDAGSGQPKPGKSDLLPKRDKEMSFSSFSRAIERGDMKTIDRTLDLPPIRVDFRDLMNGTSILHVAAKGSREMLKKLLKYPHVRGMIDAADYTGATPLMVAVTNENLPAVRILLENGAKTKYYMHETGQTVLHVAAGTSNDEILREILKYNSSSHFVDWHDKNGDTALLKSLESESKCAEILLKSGASHSAVNKATKRNILHLAVLYRRRNLLKALVKAYPEVNFIAAVDANGDSPLTFAYRLKDPVSAKILLRSSAGAQLVADFPDILIRTIKLGDERLFADVLNHSAIDDVTKYCNEDGDNALMVAAASQHVYMVKKLLAAGVKVIPDDTNGQTILDKIENIKNALMAKIILNAIFAEIQSSEIDFRSTYDAIIRRGSLENFIVFYQSGLFDDCRFLKAETHLYLAAKRGNYGACLFLLLSEKCSKLSWVGDALELPTERDLLRLFLKREIFASDLYILSGKVPDNPQWNYTPKQGHLFENSDEDRNIFHACALGGSLETLVFIYRYCQQFRPKECRKLDAADASGATPLLLAIFNKKSDLALFFIQNGASLIKNSSSQTPLNALRKHIVEHKSLLTSAMTQSILVDETPSKKGPKSNFSLHFYIFRPHGAETSDVGMALASLSFNEYEEVLCHPLFEYFVWSLWKIAGPSMVVRFYVDVVAVLTFSSYLTVRFSGITSTVVEKILWFASVFLAGVNLFIHLPIGGVGSTMERRFLLKMKVVVPVAVVLYLAFFDGRDRNSLEFGGTAVLMSWLALLFHGVATPMGEQITSFWIVFLELLRVAPTFFIVTFSFTMLLFTLFHGYVMYNNPFQAFLFASYQIPAGYVDKVPSLYQKFGDDVVQGRAVVNWTSFESPVNATTASDNPLRFIMGNEIRAMFVEGSAVIFYLLLATALTNMLTALAIRKGREHLKAKKAKALACKMTRIHEWEKFSDGKFHDFLHKCKALWVVGVHPRIKESFNIALVAHPTKTKDDFDIFKMKHFLTQKETLISNVELDFLLLLLAVENFHPQIKSSLRTETE